MKNPPKLSNKLVRVTSIRSQHSSGSKGAIFRAVVINDSGKITDATEYVVVKTSSSLLGGSLIEEGQTWEVYGEIETTVRVTNGYRFKELQISPHSMRMVKPSGEHIIQLMAHNPSFKGIGIQKSQELWDRFGEQLYSLLDKPDIAQLSQVISNHLAHTIVDAWAEYGDTKTIKWLIDKGIAVDIGQKIIKAYKKEAPLKIEEDPYRLLSFVGNWNTVDNIALKTFGLERNDPRRFKGAIEEALYLKMAEGNTASSLNDIHNLLKELLKTTESNWSAIIADVMTQGYASGSFVLKHYQPTKLTLHAIGPYVMEKTIAHEVALRTTSKNETIPQNKIEEILDIFEIKHNFSLNEQQRLAVALSAQSSFHLICGGAGTGKTSVLKSLYSVYEQSNIEIHQIALTGKASKRMEEATGISSSTIASFLLNVSTKGFNENTVIIIDESSMIDVGTMYKLLNHIPSETRIIMVGDPAQIQPIGAGLVFHSLLEVPHIPKTELKEVNRYTGNIANAAKLIRDGIYPEFSTDVNQSIYFIPCHISEIKETQTQIYGQFLRNNTEVQILEPVKKGKYCGTQYSNQNCQKSFANDASPINAWNYESEEFEYIEINKGEPVICTKNHWSLGLQNGSLGRVVNVYKEPKNIKNKEKEVIGKSYADVKWDDGVVRELSDDVIDDIELSYSITIHKSQGSEFETVIIPVYQAKNFDRSMLYTAITRAKKQVILIGDMNIAKTVIEDIPHYQLRTTGLFNIINEVYQESILL